MTGADNHRKPQNSLKAIYVSEAGQPKREGRVESSASFSCLVYLHNVVFRRVYFVFFVLVHGLLRFFWRFFFFRLASCIFLCCLLLCLLRVFFSWGSFVYLPCFPVRVLVSRVCSLRVFLCVVISFVCVFRVVIFRMAAPHVCLAGDGEAQETEVSQSRNHCSADQPQMVSQWWAAGWISSEPILQSYLMTQCLFRPPHPYQLHWSGIH